MHLNIFWCTSLTWLRVLELGIINDKKLLLVMISCCQGGISVVQPIPVKVLSFIIRLQPKLTFYIQLTASPRSTSSHLLLLPVSDSGLLIVRNTSSLKNHFKRMTAQMQAVHSTIVLGAYSEIKQFQFKSKPSISSLHISVSIFQISSTFQSTTKTSHSESSNMKCLDINGLTEKLGKERKKRIEVN